MTKKSPNPQISPTTTPPSSLPVDDTLQTMRFLIFRRSQKRLRTFLFPVILVCQLGSFCSPLPSSAFAQHASVEGAGEQEELVFYMFVKNHFFASFISCHQGTWMSARQNIKIEVKKRVQDVWLDLGDKIPAKPSPAPPMS